MYKVDPLKGMNPDQSGPKEKIQNGDPKSIPERDQRSGAAESGGPGPSLQEEPTSATTNLKPQSDGLVKTDRYDMVPGSEVPDMEDQERVGAYDRAGEGTLVEGRLKDKIPGDAYAGPNRGGMVERSEGDDGGDKVAGNPKPKDDGKK